jgi:ferrochelatase
MTLPFQMTTTALPQGHVFVPAKKVGVLIVNLGTPDATTYWPMRRYLKEFLSDSRVIETNRVLWWLLLNGIILSFRPTRSGKAYASIWNKELNESPLRTITRAQSEKLVSAFAKDRNVIVNWAMRYGTPSIVSRLEALHAQGCEKILLFPLYPQYAASTTATVCDKAFDWLKTVRWQPTLRVVPPYHDDRVYITTLADSIRSHIADLDHEPEVVIASFHGLPRTYLDKGDPYHCHCAKTARLLREELGWSKGKLVLAFQSRFGQAEWLKPYTAETVAQLARDGIRRIAVIAPGFVADCVETLEELHEEVGNEFKHNGGTDFSVIPCLNDSDGGIAVLETVIRRELQGWL